MPRFDFRSIYLPYCLELQPNGTWLVLNRDYKPVGFNTDQHIKYEEYPVSVKLKGLTKLRLAKLSSKAEFASNRVFLYDDGCVPTHSAAHMKSYMEKLEILAKLSVA